MNGLLRGAELFEPRDMIMSAGRSLIAVAELTVLLATPQSVLFGVSPSAQADRLCSGLGTATLWCVTPAHLSYLSQLIAVTILVCVILGLWPRRFCIAHWYVAFSMATRMIVLNGGEEVGQILTLLLIPICLGDSRMCHWRRPSAPMAPGWRGSAYAGHLVLRWQIAIIYLEASLSKLLFPAWRAGTAIPILLNDPQFGLPMAIRPTVEHIIATTGVGFALTWSVMAIEICIALAMLSPAPIRRFGVALAVCLHLAIVVAMGLFSFGLIMIALVLIGFGGGSLSEYPYACTSDGITNQERFSLLRDAADSVARRVVRDGAR